MSQAFFILVYSITDIMTIKAMQLSAGILQTNTVLILTLHTDITCLQ